MRALIFILVLLIPSLCAAQPQTTLLCNRNQGVWTNSEGVRSCRDCPDTSLFLSEEPLKLPEGCVALKYGAFMRIDTFKRFVTYKEHAESLEAFVSNMNPLLTVLKQQIHVGNKALETLQYDYNALRDYNTQLKVREQNLTLTITRMHYVVWSVSIALAGALSYIAFR